MTQKEEIYKKARKFVLHDMKIDVWYNIKNELYINALIELYNDDCFELEFKNDKTKVRKVEFVFTNNLKDGNYNKEKLISRTYVL